MDEFRVKSTEQDFSLVIIYDRWGGMKVIKQSNDGGNSKYQELYLPKEAMMDLAVRLLHKECCK